MDGAGLIEVVKSGLTIAGSTISAITGALLSTFFLRKNTDIQEFEKGKQANFAKLADSLLNSGKMSPLEYAKCKNYLQIAEIAQSYYEAEHKQEETPVPPDNFDWFVRFYEYAGNISNQDMQHIWGKILCGEVANPNSVSFTLLNALFLLDQTRAEQFCNIARWCLNDTEHDLAHLLIFISRFPTSYEHNQITSSMINAFVRLGLIECNYEHEFIFHNKKIFRKGNHLITVLGNPENNNKIKAGNVRFTEDGQTLYNALSDDVKEYNSSIVDAIITCFEKNGCKVLIDMREPRKHH